MSTKQRRNEFGAKAARIALALCLVAAVAQGHVSVSPQQSKTGATEHYVVRVPTEGSVSTVSVDLEIPAGVIVGEIAATPDARYEVTRRVPELPRLSGRLKSSRAVPSSFLSPPRIRLAKGHSSGKPISTLPTGPPKIGFPQPN